MCLSYSRIGQVMITVYFYRLEWTETKKGNNAYSVYLRVTNQPPQYQISTPKPFQWHSRLPYFPLKKIIIATTIPTMTTEIVISTQV